MKKDSSKERTQRYRERLRENADEWADAWGERYPTQSAEVSGFVKGIGRKVLEEFTPNPQRHLYFRPFSVEETVDYVARTLYAFRKDGDVWVRKTSDGIIAAGSYFPDGLGWMIVTGTHENNLETSPTYSALYRELLLILDQRFGNNHDRNSEAIKQELAGKFVLSVESKPEPSKSEPIQVKPEPRVPPPTVDAPPITGYETPSEEQNRLIGFGTFGMTRTSHL